MSFEIDTESAARAATRLGAAADQMGEFERAIQGAGSRLHVIDWATPPGLLARELADEMRCVAEALSLRVRLAVAADVGWSSTWIDRLEQELGLAVGRLAASLGDRIGAAGDGCDRRLSIAADLLGIERVLQLTGGDVGALLEHVLDSGDAEAAREYWELLPTDDQDTAIEATTAAVSDAYLRGDIDLDDVQVTVLQLQPVPTSGRRPMSGPNTDWAGVSIPQVQTPATETGGSASWAYDEDPRSLAGGSLLCSAVQVLSAVPSSPGSSAAGQSIAAAGLGFELRRRARQLAAPSTTIGARAVPVVAILASFGDVGLCRLGVGSGAPISTSKTVNADGEEVYEGSRGEQRYQLNGVPLSPEPRQRDVQMWNFEHSNEFGLVTDPYPGFPAYDVNAPGYAGDDS